MALDLLSGPNLVYDPGTGLPMAIPTSSSETIWLDPRGLLFDLPAIILGRGLIQMDGALHVVGLGRRLTGLVLRNPALVIRGGSVVEPSTGERTYGAVEGTISTPARVWAYDPVTLVETEELSANAPAQANNGLGMAFLPDRFLRVAGSKIQTSSGFGVAWTDEATLPITSGWYFSWADHINEIWVANRAGLAVRYNFESKSIVGGALTTGVENRGLYWSRKHHVFVGLYVVAGQPSQLATRVWGPTARPAVITAPVAASAVREGAAVTLTTRVTGAHTDPCPDEVVGWAVSGGGSLVRASSKTDADGYAVNTLQIPLGTAGPIDVDVEVQF